MKEVESVFSEEHLVHDPGHVARRHEGTDASSGEGQPETIAVGPQEDFVLRPEAGERDYAGQRQIAHEKGSIGPRHVLAQAPHPLHLKTVMRTRVTDGAGALEQERLEECMREEMEDGAGPCAHRQRHDHVAELAHGRIGEHLLYVGLHECQSGRHHQRDRPDPRAEVHSSGVDRKTLPENAVQAGEQIDAGHHHRGGMDQRTGGRRTGHGVRKPSVERELGRLAYHSAEQRHRGHEQHQMRGLSAKSAVVDGLDVEAAAADEVGHHDADEQSDVARTRGEKGLERSVGVVLVFPPMADEQERAEAHQLPADQQFER